MLLSCSEVMLKDDGSKELRLRCIPVEHKRTSLGTKA